MGSDDDRDCVEHIWVMRGVTFALDGAHIDYTCTRCGTLLVEGPDELMGNV